jgi:hypothetical protein
LSYCHYHKLGHFLRLLVQKTPENFDFKAPRHQCAPDAKANARPISNTWEKLQLPTTDALASLRLVPMPVRARDDKAQCAPGA